MLNSDDRSRSSFHGRDPALKRLQLREEARIGRLRAALETDPVPSPVDADFPLKFVRYAGARVKPLIVAYRNVAHHPDLDATLHEECYGHLRQELNACSGKAVEKLPHWRHIMGVVSGTMTAAIVIGAAQTANFGASLALGSGAVAPIVGMLNTLPAVKSERAAIALVIATKEQMVEMVCGDFPGLTRAAQRLKRREGPPRDLSSTMKEFVDNLYEAARYLPR